MLNQIVGPSPIELKFEDISLRRMGCILSSSDYLYMSPTVEIPVCNPWWRFWHVSQLTWFPLMAATGDLDSQLWIGKARLESNLAQSTIFFPGYPPCNFITFVVVFFFGRITFALFRWGVFRTAYGLGPLDIRVAICRFAQLILGQG